MTKPKQFLILVLQMSAKRNFNRTAAFEVHKATTKCSVRLVRSKECIIEPLRP